MNGTSMDGVDWVLCDVHKKGTHIKINFCDMATTAINPAFKKKLTKAAQHKSSTAELLNAHFELGQYYAQKLKTLSKKRNWLFEAVGFHGQTVYHQGKIATLQIGESSFLKKQFPDVFIVNDFRVADIASKGEGAPLAPVFHQQVLKPYFKNHKVAVHNLGGISNVTYFQLDSKGQPLKQVAFDTGPANMLIDLGIQKLSGGQKEFDLHGRWAAQGKTNLDVLNTLLKDKYFKKPPPKSCGREEFGEDFLKKTFSLLKNQNSFNKLNLLTELSVKSIERAYRQHLPELPDVIIVCGGGIKNKYLMKRLRECLPEARMESFEDYGWPTQAVEGGAFALLAALRLWNIKVNTRPWTGAKTPVLLGKIT